MNERKQTTYRLLSVPHGVSMEIVCGDAGLVLDMTTSQARLMAVQMVKVAAHADRCDRGTATLAEMIDACGGVAP